MKPSTQTMKPSTQTMKPSTQTMKPSTQTMKPSTQTTSRLSPPPSRQRFSPGLGLSCPQVSPPPPHQQPLPSGGSHSSYSSCSSYSSYLFPAALLVLLPILASCDWRSDGAARLEKLYPVPEVVVEDIVIPEVDIGDVGTAEGLGGWWVMRVEEHGTMLLGEIHLTDLFLVRIPAEGDKAELTFCEQIVEMPQAAGLGATQMPDALKTALGKTPMELDVDAEALSVQEQKVAWTWGIQGMKDRFADPIPTKADNPLVWDQDEDGNPGVTMHVLAPEGDRYMVRREVMDVAAGTTSEDGQWLVGKLEFDIDEGAVGYFGDKSLMTVAAITPTPGGNVYRLRRVGADPEGESPYDCKKLSTEHLGIFQGAPEPGARD